MLPTITLATSLRSLRFRLWDEENKMFVSFKEIKTRSAAPKASRMSSQTKSRTLIKQNSQAFKSLTILYLSL